MNILAIGAHPDDIEIGCARTLLELKEKHDAKITLMVLTGNNARCLEQEQACEVLGIKECVHYNFSDTAILLKAAILKIEENIEKLQPDYIFTHYQNDTHQDHRTVAKATLSACRNRKNILFYESLSTENFTPNLLVDIEKYFHRKCEALEAHKSQAPKQFTHYIKTLSAFRAHRTGLKHVEGFMTRKFLWVS